MTEITIQNPSGIKQRPAKKEFQTWIDATLPKNRKDSEINIRIVDTKESTKLNREYRKKNSATNIISFRFEPPPMLKSTILGDLVICAPLVRREAKDQNKTIISHWAHLTVHGTLHLLGYDHLNSKEAEEMERLEIKILKKLGFENPYGC